MYLDEKLSTDIDRVRGGKLVVTREKEEDKTQPEGTRRYPTGTAGKTAMKTV